MTQTKIGAMKARANKLGISLEEYIENLRRLNKWCYSCKEWHHISLFGKDSTRYDGLVPACKESRNRKARDHYISKPRKIGRRFVEPRNGDRQQAYGRIHHLINIGILPEANKVPCIDCGHIYDGITRHEYDHFIGYDGENQDIAEVVCTKCHHKRHPIERERNEKGEFISGYN